VGSNRRWAHGKYTPVNKQKYRGKKIPVYRSSWERKFMVWCDLKTKVVAWDYECLTIPYINTIDKQEHRYILDFLVDIKNPVTGAIDRYAIEVKPLEQLLPPDKTKIRSKKRFAEMLYVYTINRDKRNATLALCKKKGWKYKAVTEKDLFGID